MVSALGKIKDSFIKPSGSKVLAIKPDGSMPAGTVLQYRNNWVVCYVVRVAPSGKVSYFCFFGLWERLSRSLFFVVSYHTFRPFSQVGNSRLHSTPHNYYSFYGSVQKCFLIFCSNSLARARLPIDSLRRCRHACFPVMNQDVMSSKFTTVFSWVGKVMACNLWPLFSAGFVGLNTLILLKSAVLVNPISIVTCQI